MKNVFGDSMGRNKPSLSVSTRLDVDGTSKSQLFLSSVVGIKYDFFYQLTHGLCS